jgi:FMN phosphatase YigB (HAD superfamily)
MMKTMRLEAIFFDAGGTLFYPDRSVTLAPLYERGAYPTDAQLYAAERHAKHDLDAVAARTHKVDQQYWENYYGYLLQSLNINDVSLRLALVNSARTSSNWRYVLPGTREILQKFPLNYKLGVISNSDGRIANLFAASELAGCFLSITDSGQVGHEKPDRRIFEAALRSLNVSAEKSLYLGDIYSVDYLGAVNAGMHGLLLDPAGTYATTATPRIESLAELESKLGEIEAGMVTR